MNVTDSEDAWHYARGDEQAGPISGDELCTMISSGELDSEVLCWRSGLEEWVPANSLVELSMGSEKRETKLKLARRDAEPTANAESGSSRRRVPIDVQDMLADSNRVKGKRNKSFLLEEEKLSERSFEFMFFCVCLLFAFFATGITLFVAPALMPVPSAGFGILCMAVGLVLFRVRTFQVNVWWGVGGLFLGISDLFFVCLHWERSWRPLLLLAIGTFFALAAITFGYDQAVL